MGFLLLDAKMKLYSKLLEKKGRHTKEIVLKKGFKHIIIEYTLCNITKFRNLWTYVHRESIIVDPLKNLKKISNIVIVQIGFYLSK